MKKLFILVLMSILGLAAAAAPTNWNATPAAGSNNFPFNANPGTGKKVQWVVAAGEFSQPTPVGAGNNITSLWFLANSAGNATYTNLTIRLASVSTATFLGIGAFYSGAMTTVLSQTTTLAPSAAQTWFEIPLTTPFPYDPTQNLIVEVSQCGFTGAGFTLAQQAFGTAPDLRRQYSDSSSPCGVTANPSGGDLNVAGIGISFVAGATVAPTITKSFGASSIAQNNATTLTVAIQNPNSAATLTGVGVSDTFPAGLEVATPNGLVNTCDVTPTAVAGTAVVSLTGATLAANASCSFTVNVTATTPGVKNNTTAAVTSIEGGTGSTASASLTVVAPVTISKSFGASSVAQFNATTLTLIIQNPNLTTALTGVGVSDTFPAGLEVATPNGLVNTCDVTPTAVAGTGVVSLTGATLAANASCSFTVNVTATTAGVKNNTTDAVTSIEGGAGSTASASVTVAAPVPIPTLNEWLLALLAMALLGFAAPRFSRRR